MLKIMTELFNNVFSFIFLCLPKSNLSFISIIPYNSMYQDIFSNYIETKYTIAIFEFMNLTLLTSQ